VQRAQAYIAEALTPGALAVDATVGRGGDTLFLAERVGPRGVVLGLDIQAAALQETGSRLKGAGLAGRVRLCRVGHAHLQRAAPEHWQGRVAAVMFNLGYLPGGDRQRTTRPATTQAALDAARAMLAPGGRLSVLAYRGHAGGSEEARAVAAWAEAQSASGLAWAIEQPPDAGGSRPPWWLAARKPGAGYGAMPSHGAGIC
jgi:16S rRNA C1402 N4-methylase RsmH